MVPCTIKDLVEVSEVASKFFGTDSTLWARQKLYSPIDRVFYFDEDLVLLIEAIGNYKYSIHTIGSTRKVKEYKNFTIDAGKWMFENTQCTCLIAFAAASNVRMQRFIGLTGGKRVGVIPDAGGHEDEIMYVYPIRDKVELEGRRSGCQ